MHDFRLRRCYGYGAAWLPLRPVVPLPREDATLWAALTSVWQDGKLHAAPGRALRLAAGTALLTFATTLLFAGAAQHSPATRLASSEMVWLAPSRPRIAAPSEAGPRISPPAAPKPAPTPDRAPLASKPEPAPRPAPELRVDPAPALPSSVLSASGAEFRAPRLRSARTPHPDAQLLAMDSLGANSDPAPLGSASSSRASRPSSLRPVAAPARPSMPKPVALAAPEPVQAPDPPPRVARLAGVPLSAFARCAEDSEEDRLKERILSAVPRASRCDGDAGTYHFLQTQNLNAFLMRIERSSDRNALDRCAELDLALRCLAANGRKELGS